MPKHVKPFECFNINELGLGLDSLKIFNFRNSPKPAKSWQAFDVKLHEPFIVNLNSFGFKDIFFIKVVLSRNWW